MDYIRLCDIIIKFFYFGLNVTGKKSVKEHRERIIIVLL